MSETHFDEDAQRLAEMGYTQELHRGMSGFSNFAVSFSIISILAGCITSYRIALVSGGPSAIVLGWAIVGAFVLCVSLSMAEVCSRYPTAGGLYFWAGELAKTNKRAWAWFVGWFNFMGEIAVTAAIDFGCATTSMAFANLVWDVNVTAERTFPYSLPSLSRTQSLTPLASTWCLSCRTFRRGGTSSACSSSLRRCGSCPKNTSRWTGP